MTTTEARAAIREVTRATATTTDPREAAIRATDLRAATREAREATRETATTTGPREAAIRAIDLRAAIREAREATRATVTTTDPREAAIRETDPRAAIRAREVTRATATTDLREAAIRATGPRAAIREATRATATTTGPREAATRATGLRAATAQDPRAAIRAVREMTRMQGITEAGMTAAARQEPETENLPLTPQSRQSQPATARTRILIRMTGLISATGWRTARRKCRRQEREHLSCPSLRRRSPRRMR